MLRETMYPADPVLSNRVAEGRFATLLVYASPFAARHVGLCSVDR